MTVTAPGQQTQPPGPVVGMFDFSLVRRYMESPLDLLMDLSRYGDFVYFKLGGTPVYLISDPAALHQILVADAKKYYKTDRTKAVMGEFLGNGLLMSDGDFWRRQRRLTQPAFHHQRVNRYLDEMVALTNRAIADWQPGGMRDIDRDMMHLALDIAAKTMFNVDQPALAAQIDAALTPVQEIGAIKMRALFPVRWLPTNRNRRYGEAITRLRGLVGQVIDERRASGHDKGDLLSMLLLATDEDGERMSDVEALDEGMNLLLAGHDTTALALSWAWYALANNPNVLAKLVDEIDSVLGGAPLTLEALPRLKYLDQVAKETLRLYPSAWLFLRQPVEDVEIGGYAVPAGARILISPYTMHRNPRYFPDPERFDPDRFTPENEAKLPKFVYLPFSSGPRVCIGNAFASMEMRAVMATVLQRFRLEGTPETQPQPDPALTLRIANGMPMRVVAR